MAAVVLVERVVQGTVVDESGVMVDGAAVDVGGSTVFTDSRGRFFVRRSSRRVTALTVLVDEFLATGRFEVVSSPAAVTPQLERESVPVRIVVRRVPPDRVSTDSSTVPARPPQPNE